MLMYNRILKFINKQCAYSQSIIAYFGIFCIINYPLFSLVEYMSHSESIQSFTLRMIAGIIAIPLIFSNCWPKKLRLFLGLYWYMVVIYCLPFFCTYNFLISHGSTIWLLNSILATLLLIIIVDWLSFVICSILGIGIAVILYIMKYGTISIDITNLTNTIINIIWIILVCTAFSYNRQSVSLREKKLLKNEVTKRTQDLAKALSVKTEFLNNISHEIRGPVAGFSMAADNLMSHWNSLKEGQKFDMVKVIASSAERIKNLSMHLIDATKLQSGANILNFQKLNLTKLIHDFIDEARALYIKEKNISIKFKYQDDYFTDADYEAISQILRNLVTNAIKFSPANSTVSIKLEEDNGMLQVTIRDQGVGVPQNELEQIFAPFYQSSRTKTGAGGVGLGLNIAKQIVEAHGGKIWTINNRRGGASFIFTLKPEKSETISASKTTSNINFEKKTILLIDDDQAIHASLTLGLFAQGLKTLSAMDGFEGLELLEKLRHEIDIVVLDIMMPGMSGFEVLKVIKHKWPDLKVVMHSGFASSEDIEKTKQLGAIAIIKKPYKITELLEHLAKEILVPIAG